jgi:hypothetical protein
MGAIAPAPENAHKIKYLWGVVDRARKHNFLSHFIHFQLQNNAPICPANSI